MLQNHQRLTEKTSDIEAAIFVLKDVYEESERILGKEDVPLEVTEGLLSYVSDIRSRLTELESTMQSMKDTKRLRFIRHLKDCYSTLETRAETIINGPEKKRQ